MNPLETDPSERPSWVAAAEAFGVPLTAAQIAQFERYEQLLQLWNRRLNLTAITEPAEIRIRHFLDSLSCALALRARHQPGDALIDVGTGAGFPGLPIKIAFPDLDVTLVDSVAKKVRFLETVAGELGLTGVTAISARAETLGRDLAYRERFDWVVARSVAELRVLGEYLLPLCRPGGRVIAQKGESAPDEAAGAAGALALLGGEVEELVPVDLPGHDRRHYLVVIVKKMATPAQYPRRPGMPAKRPLG